MNLSELMRNIKKQAEDRKEGKVVFNQSEILNSASVELKKHEMKANSDFIFAIGKCLSFNFNPTDPDEVVPENYDFVLPDSSSKGILAIKEAMREDEKLHSYYAKFAGLTKDTYNIDLPENGKDVVTAQDFKIFRNFQKITQVTVLTQKIKTDEAGQYGKKFRTPLRKNLDNSLTEDTANLLEARIFNFEKAIVSEKMAEFIMDKDKSKLSKTDKEKYATIRQSKQMTYPNYSGVIPFVEFEMEGQNELTPFKPIKDLKENMGYINCDSETLGKLNQRIGTKQDIFTDFLLIRTHYGNPKVTEKSEELALYSSREFFNIEYADDDMTATEAFTDEEGIEDPRPFFRVSDKAPTFEEVFETFHSEGMAGMYKKAILSNVINFRPITGDYLKKLFFSRMAEVKNYVTQEIFDNFIDLIDVINPMVSQELVSLNKQGKLSAGYQKMIEGLPNSDEAKKLRAALDKIEEPDSNDEIKEQTGLTTDDIFDEEIQGIGDLVGVESTDLM